MRSPKRKSNGYVVKLLAAKKSKCVRISIVMILRVVHNHGGELNTEAKAEAEKEGG